MRVNRLAALAGVAGPVLFTVAWVAGSLRQAGYCPAGIQLSGLAAEDARDPQIMIGGFVVLGVCSIGFGAALARVTPPRSAGPWLVVVAGAAAVAAGVFRRDHMLLTGPGFTGESWHNQVHDLASGVAYGAMLAAPLLLGRRFRADPRWAAIARPFQVLALASGVALAVFASRVVEPWNGVLQRSAVTLALAAEVVIALRMLTLPRRAPRLDLSAPRNDAGSAVSAHRRGSPGREGR
jgi:protein-S-isoprenylcysteine O-methyltransferase Ste14